jgi:hypothetical protein
VTYEELTDSMDQFHELHGDVTGILIARYLKFAEDSGEPAYREFAEAESSI